MEKLRNVAFKLTSLFLAGTIGLAPIQSANADSLDVGCETSPSVVVDTLKNKNHEDVAVVGRNVRGDIAFITQSPQRTGHIVVVEGTSGVGYPGLWETASTARRICIRAPLENLTFVYTGVAGSSDVLPSDLAQIKTTEIYDIKRAYKAGMREVFRARLPGGLDVLGVGSLSAQDKSLVVHSINGRREARPMELFVEWNPTKYYVVDNLALAR